jgi:cytochrome bd ubiquinol oxidase subunit II
LVLPHNARLRAFIALFFTVWGASSSERTLAIMTVAMVILLPIVLAYTGSDYRVLRGPVTEESLTGNSHSVC